MRAEAAGVAIGTMRRLACVSKITQQRLLKKASKRVVT